MPREEPVMTATRPVRSKRDIGRFLLLSVVRGLAAIYWTQ
jgi:hypothetical protein